MVISPLYASVDADVPVAAAAVVSDASADAAVAACDAAAVDVAVSDVLVDDDPQPARIAVTIAVLKTGQSFFSWDCHHIVYWLVTPPLTGWKSNAVRLLPTAKNSRTI